jgi:hypothetical protein
MNVRKPNTDKPVSLTPEQIKTTVSFLNRSFREVADEYKSRTGLNSNTRGSTLYDYQTDFAYIIDKIQRGPIFFAIQNIAEANDLIGKLSRQQKE